MLTKEEIKLQLSHQFLNEDYEDSLHSDRSKFSLFKRFNRWLLNKLAEIKFKEQKEKFIDTETASEPITNALYATGQFTADQCDQIAEGILQYIEDYGFIIIKKN